MELKPRRRHRWASICLTICFLIVALINGGMFVAVSRLDTAKFEHIPSFCETADNLAPVITIKGSESIGLVVGEDYDEVGADVVDDCGEAELITSGEVNTAVAGIYIVRYSSIDRLGNSAEAVRTVNVVPEYRGTVYLTFDDGPGPYTAELLDVLKRYNVKATFFVTGSGDDALILREYNEGHAIALHSMTHNYSYIYQNFDTFFEDLYAIQNRVKNITGYTSYLMRFPGGSSNTVSARHDGGTRIMSRLINEVEARGFTYFDWNVTSGDAGQATTADQVYENVIYALKEGGSSVVLQHDIKGFSVAAVERIIQYGLANGYVFSKLDASSFTAHHGVNN